MKRSGLIAAIAFAALPALTLAQPAKTAAKTPVKAAAKTPVKVAAKVAARPARKADTQASLREEAKISEAAAREIALKQVKSGTIKSAELEREKGRLVYSFDITVPAQRGIEEVLVDAKDGAIISRTRETPKMERAEARKEAREKRSAARNK